MIDNRFAFPVPADLPRGARLLGELRCREPETTDAQSMIAGALDHPVRPDGTERTLADIVRPGETVCIVVSDYTRKTAADLVLPVLLERLAALRVAKADITLLVATGIHRAPSADEIRAILGPRVPTALRDRVVCHDPDDPGGLVSVGTTERGHPVRVNRCVTEADRVILTGAAQYHYHAGFGGGRKSLVPGVASRDTIAYNHSLTLDPAADRVHAGAAPGNLDGNPVAEEMLAGARLCEPDFIINTVLTATGRLADVVAGELDTAHRQACRTVEAICRMDIRARADLVVASAVGAPNWIQSHKALFNASRAVKSGGRVVLLAPCPEGIGNDRFRHWVTMPDTPRLIAALRTSPEVLGQTALSTRERGKRTLLVTQLAPAAAKELGIATADTCSAALRTALADLSKQGCTAPTVWLMPEARYTVPFPKEAGHQAARTRTSTGHSA